MTTGEEVEGFALRLRAERLRLGASQGEVAARVGVAKPTQVAYEQGSRTPSIGYLVRLAELGVDVWFVLFGVRESRHASQAFNWNLLSQIHSAVSNWCQSKDIELTALEEIEVGRLLYDQFLGEACIDLGVVDRMMAVATSRRAA